MTALKSTPFRASAWLVGGVLVASGCVRNPATGERQLSLVSEAQEVQLGQQAAREVEQTIGLVDQELQAYVARVGSSSLPRRNVRRCRGGSASSTIRRRTRSRCPAVRSTSRAA